MLSENNLPTRSVMVLGASSWLGYLLINRLIYLGLYSISASFHKQKLSLDKNVDLFFARNQNNYDSFLQEKKPSVVVNFLRGEDDDGLAVHKDIIKYCSSSNAHYIYASSALALDAYKDKALTENLLAKSISPYGQFKADCEELLQESNIASTILRFASIQGWVPHKLTRNELFLKNISKGNEITVDRGVLQNRMSAELLVEGISEIIEKRITGIIHFGTTDYSEEYHYLKKMAHYFGFDQNLVKEGKQREVNLVTIPSRIFNDLDGNYKQTEEDTLQYLLTIPALLKYKNS